MINLSTLKGYLWQIHPNVLLLMANWVVIMILLPIILWVSGPEKLIYVIIAAVLAQFLVVISILVTSFPLYELAKMIAMIVFLAWVFEVIGSKTGIPFGDYHYTDKLNFQLLDVPILIPLAWLMMLPPSWAVGKLIGNSRITFVAISALAMTAWDLYLDPQMVSWEIWLWEKAGMYFGIPILNYIGWFIVSALITALIAPEKIPIAPLFTVYVITWLLEFIGLFFFWALPGPALFGFFGMGLLIMIGIYKSKKRVKTDLEFVRALE